MCDLLRDNGQNWITTNNLDMNLPSDIHLLSWLRHFYSETLAPCTIALHQRPAEEIGKWQFNIRNLILCFLQLRELNLHRGPTSATCWSSAIVHDAKRWSLRRTHDVGKKIRHCCFVMSYKLVTLNSQLQRVCFFFGKKRKKRPSLEVQTLWQTVTFL